MKKINSGFLTYSKKILKKTQIQEYTVAMFLGARYMRKNPKINAKTNSKRAEHIRTYKGHFTGFSSYETKAGKEDIIGTVGNKRTSKNGHSLGRNSSKNGFPGFADKFRTDNALLSEPIFTIAGRTPDKTLRKNISQNGPIRKNTITGRGDICHLRKYIAAISGPQSSLNGSGTLKRSPAVHFTRKNEKRVSRASTGFKNGSGRNASTGGCQGDARSARAIGIYINTRQTPRIYIKKSKRKIQARTGQREVI